MLVIAARSSSSGATLRMLCLGFVLLHALLS